MISITTDTPQQVLRDGTQIGIINGNTCFILKDQGGQIKGQIRKAADADLDFKVVSEFPSDGSAGDPSAGLVSVPDETKTEGSGAVSVSPPAANNSKMVAGIRYVQVDRQSNTGWQGAGVMGVMKLPD